VAGASAANAGAAAGGDGERTTALVHEATRAVQRLLRT
jgi:hypothetical protein